MCRAALDAGGGREDRSPSPEQQQQHTPPQSTTSHHSICDTPRKRISDAFISPVIIQPGKKGLNYMIAAKHKVRKIGTQSLPGLPMASSLFDELKGGAPEDATCMELWRDSILLFFADPVVGRVIIVLALLVSLTVVGFGLLICWTMLGLFFEIDNGWGGISDVCLNSTGWNATTATTTSVPMLDGEYITGFCTLNQWWFNQCVKVFVGLFTYINFLPIPWRLSCLWHVYCSRRPCHPGVDFYGRPTDALWFNLTKKLRRRVSVGLNLAWLFHFVCLATHIVWPEYIQGQTFPGVLYQNLPMVLSLFCQIAAASAQDKAERKLIAEEPDRFPAKPLDLVLSGFRKWRTGESDRRLIDTIRQQFHDALNPNVPRGGLSTGLTGIQKAAFTPRPVQPPPVSPGAPPTAAQQPIPGLPLPPSMRHALCEAPPDDSTWLERARDRILISFTHPVVSHVFFWLAVGVSLTVLAFAGLMCWCILGLFFEFDNGWGATRDICLNFTGWNSTLNEASDVPKLDGEYITGFCNQNQYWFNVCIKAFVALFTYINFLPIPWRLSCFWHVYCSRRGSEAGLDFYGRPTDALWFNLPRATRRRISMALNLAWMSHFAALGTHIVWPEYIESTTWPHVLYQNLPEILSLFFQFTAARAQDRAEDRLIAADPQRFPPKPLTLVRQGWRKWRSGEEQGRLRDVIRAQFSANAWQASRSRLTGIVTAPTQRRCSAPVVTLTPTRETESNLRFDRRSISLDALAVSTPDATAERSNSTNSTSRKSKHRSPASRSSSQQSTRHSFSRIQISSPRGRVGVIRMSSGTKANVIDLHNETS